jgi:hypothetical protein
MIGIWLPYAVGRIKEALAIKNKVHELDEFVPLYNGKPRTGSLAGRTDQCRHRRLEGEPGGVGRGQCGLRTGFELARIYAAPRPQVPQEARDRVPFIVQLLRSAPAKIAATDNLPRLLDASFIYVYIGAPERALQPYEEGSQSPSDIALLWHPTYAPVHKAERFKKVMRDERLVDYWRDRGWPEFCRPVGAGDFECD